MSIFVDATRGIRTPTGSMPIRECCLGSGESSQLGFQERLLKDKAKYPCSNMSDKVILIH